MRCPSCDHDNRPGRKFCVECGGSLPLACGACGAPYDAGEKFCGDCGAALRTAAAGADGQAATASVPRNPAPIESRKVVSIVFADLAGSTALHERLDAESVRRVMDRYYRALTAVVDAHGGTVVKLLGDGVMAAFGLRQVAEDDAVRAVRAAVAMQEAFGELAGAEPALDAAGLRVGVNTGEVVVSGAGDDVVGDPVNVAARLQEQGGHGDVVIGEATRRLVARRVTLVPLGSIRLKGRTEAVAAYRVESLEPPPTATVSPFVGRETELARLVAVHEAAVAAPAARLAVVLGSPGLGKSRLIGELSRRLGDGATVLTALCDAAGGATFAPLVVALRALLGIDAAAAPQAQREVIEAALGDDADRARIADGIVTLLSGSPASPEETFFVVRRLLAAMARQKPVVLVIDDVHWAEPLLLDLVEHLVQWGSGVPLFVLVGARPELRDLRSSLVATGDLVSEVVTLGGLDAGAAMRLAANAIGATDLPAAVAAKVLATSEGNPLFVGELVRMLVQEGALTKEGDRWIVGAGLASIEMPPTIHALLAARIERLRPEERSVLERASVVGRYFSRSAVAALLDAGDLDARLESLRRSELIERDSGWLLGEPVQRFHHVLIRDAAYRRLLKGTRAELHERLADWIEGQVEGAVEHDETIGWHLEQAHQHLRELGPIDAHGRILGERAATRLAAAGRRALARDDVPLAAGLLGRAFDRLDAAHPVRAELALDWCEALLSAGDVAAATTAIEALSRFTEGSPRLQAWHTCFAAQLAVMTAPEELHAAADRVAAAARELATLDDAAGEAKAHFVHANALARLGKVGACEAVLDQALAAARRAGDRRRANAVLAGAPQAALWGPSPVTRASGRCLDVVRVLRITQGAPAVEAVALSCQGVLEALRGRIDAARRMLATSRAMVEELGLSQRLFEVDVFIARVDLLEGDAPAAERRLRPAYDGLRDLGLGIDAALAAALLARAVLAQGRAAEAERLSHESELLAGDDLQAAISWRGVRAEAFAARGEHVAAVELAKAAVGIASATDALLDHADARVALAAALRAAGRGAEADAEERRAIDLWEAKGATVLAERARRVDAATAPAAEVSAARAGVARNVRSNFATEEGRRFDAALAAGDMEAFPVLWREDIKVVDHAHGHSYGRALFIERVRMAVKEDVGVSSRHEPLAVLGASLALCRLRITASESSSQDLAFGPTERPYAIVIEADEQARGVQVDMFLEDKLEDAVACLYERYAASLPEGPARTQAAAVARSIAVWMGRPDPGLLAAASSPFVESLDHRSLGTWSTKGLEEWVTHWRWQTELTATFAKRCHDVLAVEPQAYLVCSTYFGSDRAGGGTFENVILELCVFGADGLLARVELFEPDQESEALGRFAALTASAPSASRLPRRVEPNLATAACQRGDAAIDRGDLATCEAGFHPAFEEINHPTGSTYGRDAAVASIERLMRSHDVHYSTEPLATLGSRLLLARRHIGASGTAGTRFDVGAYENETLCLHEVDAQGRQLRLEVFAADRLRTAIVRLFERYAESLPEGRESIRSRRIASGLSTTGEEPLGSERVATAVTPAFVAIDHRSLGTWSSNSCEEWIEHLRMQNALAADFTLREDDILALSTDAMLTRQTYYGTDRSGGGAIENVVLMVAVFGADGLYERLEIFEPDREAEAFACFDALTAIGKTERPVRRRVRANTASKTLVALEAAFARRDLDGVDALLGDPLQTIEHPTGVTYGREGQLESSKRMMRLPGMEVRMEPLATLGDSLCLARRVFKASGTGEGRFDVGEYELDRFVLAQSDATGRLVWAEVFASEHLCNATARLYARYAELLPEGAERVFATGMAREYGAWDGPIEGDRIAMVAEGVAPSFVCVDHRSLGTWSSRGQEEWRQQWREQAGLAAGFTRRDLDILAFTRNANVTRQSFFGTSRASGGAVDNVTISVNAFDADGRFTRCDVFEPHQEAEALARFDELTGESPPPDQPLVGSITDVPAHVTFRGRVSANAVTYSFERLLSCLAARDADGLAQIFDESLVVVHHPTAATYGRRGMLATWSSAMKASRLCFRQEVLATLGDLLSLDRHVTSVEGLTEAHLQGFGALEIDELSVIGADESGRWVHLELFAADQLGKAVHCLYERYAESLTAERERARATAMAELVGAVLGPLDRDRLVAILGPHVDFHDHRRLGQLPSSGRDGYLHSLEALLESADDLTNRLEDVLALGRDAFVFRLTNAGVDRKGGGAFERPLCLLAACGADGSASHWELFDPDREAEALARFDALERERAVLEPVRFANLVTTFLDSYGRAFARRDWLALTDCFADACSFDDRRPLLRMELPREGFLEQHRTLFDVPNGRWTITPMATRGDCLMLVRMFFEGDVPGGGGALEIDHRIVFEVDADARLVALVMFEPDGQDAAYAELDRRFEAGLPVGCGRAWAVTLGLAAAVSAHDVEALIASFTSDYVIHDHRRLQWGSMLSDPAVFTRSQQVMVELAPDYRVRVDHVRLADRAALAEVTEMGTRDGGAFETPCVWVFEVDDGGRIARGDLYDPEHVDLARARFAELSTAAKAWR